RIREGKSGFEYVLVWQDEAGIDSDIVINEVDISNFIRAKAAIYAGVKTLVEEVGLTITDLEQIILAGAFGSYIDLDSAMAVGLLPEFNPDKILYVGNGSLMGARMSELSNHIRQDVVAVVQKMTSFELSEVANFKEQYVASLFLPHTDISLFPQVGMRLNAASAGKS
ncbi:MAG: ATP-binding protein, partial [Desulfobulbaceae bacterium]|nr:ATP-binding protein [Desulfobulbaceae bacterium]